MKAQVKTIQKHIEEKKRKHGQDPSQRFQPPPLHLRDMEDEAKGK
jgi:hypothetical protein